MPLYLSSRRAVTIARILIAISILIMISGLVFVSATLLSTALPIGLILGVKLFSTLYLTVLFTLLVLIRASDKSLVKARRESDSYLSSGDLTSDNEDFMALLRLDETFISLLRLEASYDEVIKLAKVEINVSPLLETNDICDAEGIGGPQIGLVCVTEGLEKQATSGELKAIIAHEIGHIVHKDSYFNDLTTAFDILKLISGPLIALGISAFFGFIPAVVFLVILFGIPKLYRARISQLNEFAADLYTVTLGLGESQISILRKLMVIDELEGDLDCHEGGIFSAHPSTHRRINTLRQAIDS